MTRHSLLVTFIVLAGTGAIPVVVQLLAAKCGLLARRRPEAGRPDAPVRGVGGPAPKSSADDRRIRNGAGTPGVDPRTARDRQVRCGNVLADRGHGYVL